MKKYTTNVIRCNQCGNTSSTGDYLDSPMSTEQAKAEGYTYTSEGIVRLRRACPECRCLYTFEEEMWFDSEVSRLIPDHLVEHFLHPETVGHSDNSPVKEFDIEEKQFDSSMYSDVNFFQTKLQSINISPNVLMVTGAVGVVILVLVGLVKGFTPVPFESTVTNPTAVSEIEVYRWNSFSNHKVSHVPTGSKYRNVSVLSTWSEVTGSRKTNEISHYVSREKPVYRDEQHCTNKRVGTGAASTSKKVCTTKKVKVRTDIVQEPVYKTKPVFTTYYSVRGERLDYQTEETAVSYKWGEIPQRPDVSKYTSNSFVLKPDDPDCYVDLPAVDKKGLEVNCDQYVQLTKGMVAYGNKSALGGIDINSLQFK